MKTPEEIKKWAKEELYGQPSMDLQGKVGLRSPKFYCHLCGDTFSVVLEEFNQMIDQVMGIEKKTANEMLSNLTCLECKS